MTLQGALRFKLTLAVLVAFALFAFAGCGGDDDGEEAEPTTSAPAEDDGNDLSALGDVTLLVWDQEVRGGQNEAMETLNAQFQEMYPNITIEREAKSFTDLQATLKLAASSPNPPDVIEVNNGYSAMGPLVEADLLLPLDDFATQYGWGDRFSEGILKMNQFSPDGQEFGTGSIYGLPIYGEVVGVYYNKAKLADLGLEVPATWEDFVAALAAAKAGGETAIQFGNLDQWPGIHEFEEIQLQHVDRTYARDFIFGEGEQTFDDEGNVTAAATLADWAEQGYFTDGYNGLGYDPSWQQFGEGQGVFLITGSWLTADLKAALGDDVGFFLVPPPEGGSLATLGGEGLPWSISSKTENPEAAAAYIDFITSDEAMQVLTDNGLLAATTASVTVPAGLDTEVYEAWVQANEEDAIVPYLDWATPTMYDTTTAAIQELMVGRLTPDEFVARIQDDYESFHQG